MSQSSEWPQRNRMARERKSRAEDSKGRDPTYQPVRDRMPADQDAVCADIRQTTWERTDVESQQSWRNNACGLWKAETTRAGRTPRIALFVRGRDNPQPTMR